MFLLGLAIASLPFIAITAFIIREQGVRMAVFVWVCVAAIVTPIFVGIVLMTGGLE